jgi:hypothetical protein
MAFYQILYWQDVPTQVKAWDDFDEIKVELSSRFAEKIDRMAMTQKLTGADDYINQLKWGEEMEREGSADEVAEEIRKQLDADFKN